MQDATGAREHYSDISDEIELRTDVYATRYQTLRVRLEDIARENREREDEAREEAERQNARQQQRVNTALGILAFVLALPAVIDITPGEGWTKFGCGVVVVAAGLVAAGWFLGLRKLCVEWVRSRRLSRVEPREESTAVQE